jgi:hypothetical protein
MTTADTFETFDKDAMSEITAKEIADKVDHVWADRINTLPVGHGFRARRDDSETVRQFKRRVNDAGRFVYRELDWFPQHKNIKPEDETEWVVKVRSLNVKAQAEAAAKLAAQNGSQASQEGQQTTSVENNPSEDGQNQEASSGPRSARNR